MNAGGEKKAVNMEPTYEKIIWGAGVNGTNLIRRFGYHGPHKVELPPLYVATNPRPPIALQVEHAKRQAAAHGYLQVIVDRTTFVLSDAERAKLQEPAELHTYVLRLGRDDGGIDQVTYTYRRGEESEVAQKLCAMVRSERNPDGILSTIEYATACCTLLNSISEQQTSNV